MGNDHGRKLVGRTVVGAASTTAVAGDADGDRELQWSIRRPARRAESRSSRLRQLSSACRAADHAHRLEKERRGSRSFNRSLFVKSTGNTFHVKVTE